MKRLIHLLTLLSVLSFSCTKLENPSVAILKKDTINQEINNLKFKLYPTATDQFTLYIPTDNSKSYKLYLKKDNQELANYSFVTDDSMPGLVNTTVKYNFLPNKAYQILIRASKENKDTVFQENFIISGYIHKYINGLIYEKLASITQRVNFDISPSRNVIFYLDYINNKLILKRLSLTDNKLEVLNNDFFSLMIRSKNDNELITTTSTFNNRYLGYDSCALIDYDVYSKNSTFIDWGSQDYGSYSRVVNNSIVASNPDLTNSHSLINLSDGSKKIYPADLRYLSENSFDNIYWGNDILDFASLTFVNRLPFLNTNASIEYFDQSSQYYITTEYFMESQSSTYYSRMVFYKDGAVAFELPFEKGRSFSLPKITNLKDNKFIFYQGYDYDSEVRLDGYYMLDLSTKKISLLQDDDNAYVKYDFFTGSDNNTFISVRPYEIFKITLKQ